MPVEVRSMEGLGGTVLTHQTEQVRVVCRYGPTQRFGTVSRVKRCGDATVEDG